MLAVQVMVAAAPELAEARPSAIEGRFDVLSGLPQVMIRPRTRAAGCLCADDDFLSVSRRRAASTDNNTEEPIRG
jgi:hypothetical protein